MTDYEIRVTRLTVAPTDQPIYSEMATSVEIVNEAAGEFVQVKQLGRDGNTIAIAGDEWPALRAAIDQLIEGCRDD